MITCATARSVRGRRLALVVVAILASLVVVRTPAMAVDPDLVLRYPLDNNGDLSNGFGTDVLDNSLLSDSTISAGPGLGQFSVGIDSWSNPVMVLKTGPRVVIASATASAALSNDLYFDVRLTPRSAMDLRAVSVDWSRGGNTNTRGWFVRSSLDGYASDLYANETPNGTATGLTSVSFDLMGFTKITTPITFRFYIYTDSPGRYMDFQNIEFFRPLPPPPPPPPPVTLPVETTTTTVPLTTTVSPTTTVPDALGDADPSTPPPLATVLALPEALLRSTSAVNPGESVSITIGGFRPEELVTLVLASPHGSSPPVTPTLRVSHASPEPYLRIWKAEITPWP